MHDIQGTITIPALPEVIQQFVGNGVYYLGVTFNKADGSTYSCLYVRVEVVA